MVSGAAIANYIFFEIATPPLADGSFALRALPRHEIWLESTRGSLADLVGALRIVASDSGRSVLRRTGQGYEIELSGSSDQTFDKLQTGARWTLTAMFDVEYQEAYESPGGYSSAYGVGYWDDVAYPSVELSRFEIETG
jgi:hypothetical protein